MQFNRIAPWIVALGVLGACTDKPEGPAGGATATTETATRSVTPTGKVITVEMYTDGAGNYFKPATIEARRGDMLRFELKSGVHNVNFLPDSNAGKTGLPPMSDFLQIPGQTWDYVVSLDAGNYYFQCDPHALLGMIGRVEVRD